MRFAHITVIILLLLVSSVVVFGVERFSPPNFDSGHELPGITTPEPSADLYEYLGVAALLATLTSASYLALKNRSRLGIFLLMIFSLIYFGFWRRGCICPVAATQNIALALFERSYTVPVTVIAFFTLPLILLIIK